MDGIHTLEDHSSSAHPRRRPPRPMSADPEADVGQSSNDECCLCGQAWTPAAKGWPLCDSPSCPNTCCADCAASASLIVADLFYCPPCMGEGRTAAAAAGGALAAAVAACAELDGLPASRRIVRKILGRIAERPGEVKFRRLRLENPAVRSYVDLAPARRILASVGFVEREEAGAGRDGGGTGGPPVERVLVLEGNADVDQIRGLVEVLDGLASDPPGGESGGKEEGGEDTKDGDGGRDEDGGEAPASEQPPQGDKRSARSNADADTDVPDAKRRK